MAVQHHDYESCHCQPYPVGFTLGWVTTENTLVPWQPEAVPTSPGPCWHFKTGQPMRLEGRSQGWKYFHEIRILKLCRTGEKAEKNSGEEQIIKLRFLQSLLLRYLFLNFVLSQIWIFCKLFYTSSYYLNVNCIDLNVLMNESWACQQAGIWLLWGVHKTRTTSASPKQRIWEWYNLDCLIRGLWQRTNAKGCWLQDPAMHISLGFLSGTCWRDMLKLQTQGMIIVKLPKWAGCRPEEEEKGKKPAAM